jgi:ABC-type dipeptide/oligopeptide/nickel transport system permease subunit
MNYTSFKDLLNRLATDRLTLIAMIILASFFIIFILSLSGFIGSDWNQEVGASYQAPHWGNGLKMLFGTDFLGRSVLIKVIKGTEVAFSVGVLASLIALVLGLGLGLLAGYFGGLIDWFVVWLYTTFSSIPYIMLLVSISFIMGKGLTAVFVALGLTSWVTLCRLVRAEVIKHKNRDYILATDALGMGHCRKMLRHLLPNIRHIVIVDFSLNFQNAVKSEVILSFLGIGVQDQPSWGKMIDDAKVELAREVWWQLAFATLALLLIVWAMNILSDSLRDCFDPKLRTSRK